MPHEYRGLILPSAPTSERKPSGHIIMDIGNGPVVTADTVQCCHGGEHFISVKGSGITRGFCTNCMARTCGNPLHDECKDWRKKMEEFERGIRLTL